MKLPYSFSRLSVRILVLFLVALFCSSVVHAQQPKITDFVLFGGSSTCSSCAVQLSASTTVSGGSVGSYNLIKSTGNSTIRSNIYSGGTIQLANSNIVTGNLAAAIPQSK